GRCPHLLHRGADHPGDGALRRTAGVDLPRLRLRRLQGEVLRSSRATHRQRRGMGPGRGRAARSVPHRRRRIRAEPRRGRVLWPKLEFVLRDAIGRDWQCGTLQVDFMMPERLDAEYVAEDGSRRVPVMLHRAIFGSFERFLGVTIEHYAGRFPLWLAPVPVVVATIVSDADEYAREVAAAFTRAGMAAELDLTNQKINAKVRDHSLRHVPV